MTADPMRLTDGSSSALVRELLGHGKSDAASELVREGAQRAAEQALAGALAGGGTTALFSSSLAKWLGSILLVGVAGAGVAASVAPADPKEPLPVARAVPAAPQIEKAAPGAREPASVSFDDLPLAPAAPSGRALGGDARPRADRLEREIGILDRARQALGAGNTSLALAELDEHAAELEILGPEAETLRIEALFAGGQTSEAVARANRFLASHGKSPLAGRVLSLKNTHEKAQE